MFDLENKCVNVNNREELNHLFEYANKRGWRWGNDGNELDNSFGDGKIYPFSICFKKNKKVYWSHSCNSNTEFKDIEKYLNPEKEMTAREFIEWFTDTALHDCKVSRCRNCKFSKCNTKCGKSLCNVSNWKNNIDELLEITKSDNVNMSPEEKAIKDIEKLIQEPNANEFVDSLKLAIEKLKGEMKNEIN